MKHSSGISKIRYIVYGLIICIFLVFVFWITLKPREPKPPEIYTKGDYSYAIDYTEYKINTVMRKYKIPGMIIALVDGNDVIYSSAYGYADIENNIKTTPDTIFKAGSISKVFTGLAVMKLQEEGLINIKKPLLNYLSDFQIINRFNDTSEITIESILEHRSGLPRGGTILGWAWDYRPYIMKAQTESLKDAHTVYPVGYRYKYSNVGYNVLGYMIEEIMDLSPPAEISAGAFPYYMTDNIFSPLGMNDSAMGSSMLMYGTPSKNPVAMGYYFAKGKNIPYNQFDIITMASGNAQTTLNDMIVFTKAMLTADENSFIKNSLLEEMYTQRGQDAADLKQNGLTWFINTEILGEKVVFHDGTNQGFISMLAMIPEYNLGLVVMANSEEFENVKSTLTFEILKVLLESKTGVMIPEKIPRDTIELSGDILKNYTGTYLLNNEVIKIIYKNNNLRIRYKGLGFKLNALSENTFTFNNPLSKSIETRVSFYPGSDFENPYMILEMGDAFHCPQYPVPNSTPSLWKNITGEYLRTPRHPYTAGEEESPEVMVISLKDGILFCSGGFALLPADNNSLYIQGGVFHGETMEYNPDTGVLIWQNYIYTPSGKK